MDGQQRAVKYIETPVMRRLAEASIKRGYNRQVPPEWVDEHLDPEGKHVVQLQLPHEHIAGERVEPHVRLAVILYKFKGEDRPQPGPAIDVSWNDYDLLPVHVMESSGV